MSNPPMGGITERKTFKYGSVTINIGRKIGNWLNSCGNQDKAMLQKENQTMRVTMKATTYRAKRTFEYKEIPFDKP